MIALGLWVAYVIYRPVYLRRQLMLKTSFLHPVCLILSLQDLVKSHLMFAVREEVEVLKEQIKELTEKNNHLMEKVNQVEYENKILKSAASAETLAELQAVQQKVVQPPTTTTS